MRVEELYRYPVKGLNAEPLTDAVVAAGGAIPWDRAFALAQGDAPFDPAAPAFLHKRNFMCLMANARIAKLRVRFHEQTMTLHIDTDGHSVSGSVLDPEDRAAFGRLLTGFLGEEARGTPAFHYVPGHVFGDQRAPVISLFNLASLAAYEAALGASRDRRRFRANVYFTGPAWCEFDWVGRELTIGEATVRISKRTIRCPATEVNPATAERDAAPIRELRALYGHADLGVHAEIIGGGRMALGDGIVLR